MAGAMVSEAGATVSVKGASAGTSLPTRQTPVKTHPHPYTPENKELLSPVVRQLQLLPQLEQLHQGVGSIQHPDASIRGGFEDFSAPLVDQVRWRDNHGSTIAGGVHDCRNGDGPSERLSAIPLAKRAAISAIPRIFTTMGRAADASAKPMRISAMGACSTKLA